MKTLSKFLQESAGQRISMRASNRPYSIENDPLVLNKNSRQTRLDVIKFNKKISPKINEALIKLIELNTIYNNNGINIFDFAYISVNEYPILKIIDYNNKDYFGLAYYNKENDEFVTFEENYEMTDYIRRHSDFIFIDNNSIINVGGYSTNINCNELITEQNIYIDLWTNSNRNIENVLLKTPFCKKIDDTIQFNLKDFDKVYKILKTYIDKY